MTSYVNRNPRRIQIKRLGFYFGFNAYGDLMLFLGNWRVYTLWLNRANTFGMGNEGDE